MGLPGLGGGDSGSGGGGKGDLLTAPLKKIEKLISSAPDPLKMLSGAGVKTDQRAIGFHLAATPPADFGWRQEAFIEAGVAGAHRPAFGGEVLVPQTAFAIG